MQGWVSVYRELLEKPIWITSTPEQKTILMTLMLMANHKDAEWEFKGEKYTVKKGQMITSLESIVLKCGKGVTIQNVRTALTRFEKYGFLTNESTNKNRLITLVNWEVYQHAEDEPNKQTNKQLTSNQQATNKQLTTNNNVKKDNNEKNDKKPSTHKFEICDMENAQLLFSLMQRNYPDVKKPNFEKWASDFRLIRERELKTDAHIKWLIKWSQNDDFWSGNILSPATLRKQWDKLVIKAKKEHEQKGKAKTGGKVDFQSLARGLYDGKDSGTKDNANNITLLPKH